MLADHIFSHVGLTNRVIADILPDEFSMALSPALIHLFNNVSEGQKYDRIKHLSLSMAIIYIGRLTRPDIILLAISYLTTKSQLPTDANYKCIRVFSYMKETSRLEFPLIAKN